MSKFDILYTSHFMKVSITIYKIIICFTRENVLLSIVHPLWGLCVTSAIPEGYHLLEQADCWYGTDLQCGRLLSRSNWCVAADIPGQLVCGWLLSRADYSTADVWRGCQ